MPPWKVAVAPTTAPEGDATVRLCDSAAMFVKEIDTDPAVAVSVLWSNFNRPSGFADTLRVDPAGAAGAAAVDDRVAGGLAAEVLVELLDEPPQPEAASAPASRSIDTQGARRVLVVGGARKVTIKSSIGRGRRL